MKSQSDFYLPSLDGIRACAAVLVFISHAGWGDAIPGGFGVTVFFFLSGYLITTLLRMEYERGHTIDFRNFYLRRVYRIFPPMYFVLLVVLLACALGLTAQRGDVAGLLAEMTQVTNYYILQVPHPQLVPFTGTYWSLAVEEHFYILFPALYLFCARRWRNDRIAAVFLALCVAELAWRCLLIYGWHVSDDWTYLASDARMDSLLYGCTMGVWRNPALDGVRRDRARWQDGAVLAAALALLAFCFLYRDAQFRATWRYTLQGVALFPLFWYAVRYPHWPMFRPLNTAPVKLLGVLSYAFYLSHLMWIGAAETLVRGKFAVAALAFVLTVAFAYAMHRLIERPFAVLRRKLHQPRARHAPAASV
ncbi:acyltransferase [Duganella sp. LX20W]|uniref:Acyltransferase n=1 Tax=Rugamonas brunnea TaxID=2758569 RepID=A0A7W2ER80_9BURK|nr:acyltransferase [Rugamonas brunnea]MBA5637142.1 acyltransferase [Rugamonas brunnea]